MQKTFADDVTEEANVFALRYNTAGRGLAHAGNSRAAAAG